MNKINLKQPKYIFPLVLIVPLACLIYFVASIFSGSDDAPVETSGLNTALPSAQTPDMRDKLSAMEQRWRDSEGAVTAVGILGDEYEEQEAIGQTYTEAQLDSILAAAAEREQEIRDRQELERSVAESRSRMRYGYDYSGDDYERETQEMVRRAQARQRALDEALGLAADTPASQRPTPVAEAEPQPELVVKAGGDASGAFNTISRESPGSSPLIRAIIDQTTKAQEGTRLRFKLLDDVEVKGHRLPKGTYLYGVVSGFGQQRVKATVSSILVGGLFLKVNLSVYDTDGMEGFYVPASEFRDFMKNAGAGAMQSNININGGYGSDITGEALALQALQNVYQSASSAISSNIRKNRAKIKYNTTIYLINSNDAR